MRCWCVIWIVLMLISMQGIPNVNNHLDTIGQAFKDEGKTGNEVISSISKSDVYATLSQKLNKKDTWTSFSQSPPITKQLPLSQIDKIEEFICVAIIHLFPRKFQSNYLS
ncbi:hypothetical protein M3936_14515 [Sutcliffiella horikoshii]|uniref:hypothetical protein n=1 Tax=Sutcliffiella horikoshii TaxID=79883 RepID=UPI00203C81C3|nr:hypothetical protein [Sutcliffiella horikoshii]MCM3618799.1 hypothetical protein [Sutcliffiella horikoshii]